MSRKPKFKPGITRVKLNPEQAVLACACYSTGLTAHVAADFFGTGARVYCQGNRTYYTVSAGAGGPHGEAFYTPGGGATSS